jgi:pimeloyl-ACP methyl ester carboxylesterase
VHAEPIRVPTRLGEIAVRVVGEGRPTVLWHSMFVDGSSWDLLVPAIRDGRRLLVVDGPGWGRSARLPHPTTMSAAVRAAEEVLRVLAPDGPVDWIGNGWGGHIGLELAATRPALIRTLITVSAPPQPITPAVRRRIRLLTPLLRTTGFVGPVRAAVLRGVLTDASRQDQRITGRVVEAVRHAGRVSVANAVRSFIDRRVDITSLLPRIEAPSLFIVGDDRTDWPVEEAERAAGLVPSAHVVVVPRSRTLLPLEQPARLAEEVRTFWSALVPVTR